MRHPDHLAEQITTALDEQTVQVPGTETARDIVPGLAETLAVIPSRREALKQRIASLLTAHPLAKVLTSMPGIGVRTGARVLAVVGDGTAFPTAAYLASYAGLAPVTHRSGISIRGKHPPCGGSPS
ncbi:transposase [Streptomyces xiangluensis]|uniref:Transposase n=1 Tax=Streptomyces xiangluensis TaxID=2665720 RepID=A0ABV8Z8M6_9ACTN